MYPKQILTPEVFNTGSYNLAHIMVLTPNTIKGYFQVDLNIIL